MTNKITTNHEEIMDWIKNRGGKPSREKLIGDQNLKGLLKINFLEHEENNISNISWEEFFRVFEENKLALFLEELTDVGGLSRIYRFLDRENITKKETYQEPSEGIRQE